jgi:hypothetical protein
MLGEAVATMQMITLVIASAMLVMLTSCETFRITPVRPTVPELDAGSRPQLKPMTADDVKAFDALPAGLRQTLIDNNQVLKEYGIRLETVIDTYNRFARAQNGINDSTMFKGKVPATKAKPDE